MAGRPWWSLQSFITAVHLHQPDFQRQAGEYESWFLKSASSGRTLSGFEHWDQVEGALLRFMIGGPLHWLGIVDLSLCSGWDPTTGRRAAGISVFRLVGCSPGAAMRRPRNGQSNSGSLILRSNGSIHAPPGTPRAAALPGGSLLRVGRPEKRGLPLPPHDCRAGKGSPAGVEDRAHPGYPLSRYAQVVPPSLVQALKRWETQGSQARLEELTVLRLKDPELMKTLRNSEAKRFLGEPLGTTAVVVKPGAWQKVVNALAEMGYFVDESLNSQ